MAIIRKPLLPLGGRYDHVVFYRLPCGLIFRFLKPHTRKRILKDPKFAEFRKCSKRMAKASKIGSAVYKALPEDFRQFWMYRAFVGEALKMLKDQEMTGEQVLESLFKTYAEVWYLKEEMKKAGQKEQGRSAGSIKHRKIVRTNIRWKEYKETVEPGDVEIAQFTAFNKPAGYRQLRNVGMGPPSSVGKSPRDLPCRSAFRRCILVHIGIAVP
jgi:hypothetical protein